jgi:hypothetical protein
MSPAAVLIGAQKPAVEDARPPGKVAIRGGPDYSQRHLMARSSKPQWSENAKLDASALNIVLLAPPCTLLLTNCTQGHCRAVRTVIRITPSATFKFRKRVL